LKHFSSPPVCLIDEVFPECQSGYHLPDSLYNYSNHPVPICKDKSEAVDEGFDFAGGGEGDEACGGRE